MSSLLIALLALLSLLAQDPARPTPRVPPVPPTRMGQELLAQRPLVAVVRTEAASPFGSGMALVRVRVESVLLGIDVKPEDPLALFAYAGDFRKGDRSLVYLRPHGEDGRWAVTQRVDGRDPDFAAKLAVTRATIGLMDEPELARREQATFALLLGWLGSSDLWTRGYAVGELRWMAHRQRPFFTAERSRRLAQAGADSLHADVRAGVESVTMVLSLRPPSLREVPQQESSRP